MFRLFNDQFGSLTQEHKLAYTFMFFKKILSDALWELPVQSSGWYPTSEARPSAGPARLWCRTFVMGRAWGRAAAASKTQTHFTGRVFLKRSHWTLERKKNILFFLPWQKRKPFQTGSTLICSKVRTHNLSSGELGLTFLLVSTNQSIYCVNQTISFQSRVLFLACGCHEKNCRKMYLWKIIPSSVVSWDGRFCYMFTHPSPGGCNFVTF